MSDERRVVDAMRSGEWLRTQWIARVAFGLGASKWRPQDAARIVPVLKRLHREGRIEKRDAQGAAVVGRG